MADGTRPDREMSSADERERLVAAALAHAEAREAVYRRPLTERHGGWKGPLAVALLVLAGALAIAPPAWLGAAAPVPLPAATRARGARLSLYLQAREVEAFRVIEGRLPLDLEEAGGGVAGVRYVRSSDRVYQLVAIDADGTTVVWDSARPAPALRSEGARLPALAAP